MRAKALFYKGEKMENEIITTNNSLDEKLLRESIAKNATDIEFRTFIEFCRATGLNPFKREIWFIKTGPQQVQMMTGINGFLSIANRHPQFNGLTIRINEQDGKLVSATCTVYRKDRKYPSEATVYYEEYAKNSPIWRTMPRMMLQKVAKSVALREAFPQEMNGIYTQEEMTQEYDVDSKNAVVAEIETTNKQLYVYDVSKYEDASKIQGILDAFKRKGFRVEGSLLYSEEPIQQLSKCGVVNG